MATYPNEVWPGDAAVEALDGTIEAATGLPYIAKGTGPTSVPSLEVQYNRREQRLNAILAGWRQGMVVDEGDGRIGVYPIEFTTGGVRRAFAGATGVSVPANAVKVVYLNSAAALVVADAWPGDVTSYLPLAIVDTTGGQAAVKDCRTMAAFHVPSLEAATVKDRRVVTAYCASVGANLNDAAVFVYDPPEDLTLAEVQVFCTATAATASVNVKEAGVSVLSAPAMPVAGSVVKPTIADGEIAGTNNLAVHVMTGATGGITNLTVTLLLKTAMAG